MSYRQRDSNTGIGSQRESKKRITSLNHIQLFVLVI